VSPPSERTAEEWGRVAVALPGWRWWFEYGPSGATRKCEIPISEWQIDSEGDLITAGRCTPDPDDPATAGCLLALLGPYACSLMRRMLWSSHDAEGWMAGVGSPAGAKFRVTHSGSSLGRACIAAAEAIGRWPGGDL
jgi:hypothetical protein